MKFHHHRLSWLLIVFVAFFLGASTSIHQFSNNAGAKLIADNSTKYSSGLVIHNGISDSNNGVLNFVNIFEDRNSKLPFLISIVFIFVSSILLTSLIKIDVIPAYLIGLYLISIFQIVITGEIASLFSLIPNRTFWLAINLVVFLVALILWLINRRPPLFGPFLSKDRWINIFNQAKKSLTSWSILWVFGVGVFIAFVYTFYLFMIVPQNIDDVLTTHLARVGYWLQNGSFYPWKTSHYDLPQVISPANAQIVILWSVLFWGGDRLAALTQWTAAIISILAIYGISRQLGHSKPKAIFLSLLFVTMPAVALQLSTALTDLMVTGLLISCVYLLFLGWNTNNHGILILSSLAIAISIGTKQTTFFAIPGLFLAFILLFHYFPKDKWRKTLIWGITSLAFFVVVGSYFYIQNQMVYGRLLGPKEVENSFTNTVATTEVLPRIKLVVDNLINFSFQSLFSEFSPYVNDFWANVFSYETRYPLDYSFGTPCFLVFLLFLFGLVKNLKTSILNRDPLKLSLIIISISYLLILMGIRQFTYAIYRYTIFSFAMLLPLAIGFEDEKKPVNSQSTSSQQPYLKGIIWLALGIMSWTILMDISKPTFSDVPLRKMGWVYKQTIRMPEFFNPLNLVTKTVPLQSSLGLVTQGKFPVSPLFGYGFERTVIPIVPSDDLNINLDKYPRADYLLVDASLVKSGLLLPFNYVKIPSRGEYFLYKRF